MTFYKQMRFSNYISQTDLDSESGEAIVVVRCAHIHWSRVRAGSVYNLHRVTCIKESYECDCLSKLRNVLTKT